MNKNKKTGFAVLAILAGILLVLFLGGLLTERKIKESVDENLSEILTYEEIDVNILNRNISFSNPEINLAPHSILADEIAIDGINYYQYLVSGKVRVGTVRVKNPDVTLRDEEEEASRQNGKFEEDINVEALIISNGSIHKLDQETKEKDIFVLLRSFTLSDVSVNAETMENKIPFRYESYNFEVDSLKMKLDAQHDFSTGRFTANDGRISANSLRILPKYDKIEFQQHIPYEKDRFELMVENVSFDAFSWDFKNDTLQLKSPLLTVKVADLEVYRNKLIRDDPRKKSLYSEKIRNLPLKIGLDTVKVQDGKIVYQEKVKESRPPGVVRFFDLDGTITNVTNIGMDRDDFPQTVVHANAHFMNEGRVEVDWEFDISNELEKFTISGTLGSVSGEALTSFVKPALNVEVEGGIDYMAFNFAGNDDKAMGDVRLKYSDFEVNVLKDDGTEKSSFWSTVANFFISDEAVNDDVVNPDLEVTRNKKRSFWNFLWLMIREGALSSFL